MKDPEFNGWMAYESMPSNDKLWIYLSPDNTQKALVNLVTGSVLLIEHRASREIIYRHPDFKKETKAFGFRPRPLI